MALTLKDRVLETASAPGTGSVSLLGAVTGYQSFSSAIGNANTCYYTIADQSGANWEVGIGTYTSSGNTLARTTVLSSSNGGSLTNFASGTQNVFVTYPSEKSVYLDASGNVQPSLGAATFTSVTDSGLTAGRVTYSGTVGLLQDSANMTFDGSTLTTLNSAYTGTLTGGTGIVNLGSGQFYKDASGNVIIGGTSPLNSGSGRGSLSVNGTTDSIVAWGIGGAAKSYIYNASDHFEITTQGSYYMSFQTANTERMRIDTSGNVGIGTSSAGQRLTVATSTNFQMRIGDSNAIGVYDIGRNSTSGLLTFYGNQTTYTGYVFSGVDGERMRIDSSGNLLVGGTTQTNFAKVESYFNGNNYSGFVANDTASASGTNYFIASNNGTNIGSIQRVGATSAVVFNTTSDQRLKSNIQDSEPVLNKLMDVKVRQFDWTDGDLHQDAGFIAQELEPILSGIVSKGKSEEDIWQLDYSRLTPYLVKAIQEQQALITNLTTRLTALENK